MRDENKLKERYELSLDNMSIVTLTMAGIVVLGAVFILGVVVGKRLVTTPINEVVAATDVLDVIDTKTAAAQAMNADASLTFQESLTAKVPNIQAPDAVAAAPADALAAVDARTEKPKEKPVAEKTPTEKSTAEKTTVEKAAKEATRDALSEKETVKTSTTATRSTTTDGALKQAIAKTAQSSTFDANGEYTLQISASQEKSEADRWAAQLRDKGYAPYVVEAQVEGKGTWYRVRMGKFGTREAASRYLTDFVRETKVRAYVTSLK